MAPKTIIAATFTAPQAEDTYEQIKIGDRVRIGKDHGRRPDPIVPPRIGNRIQLIGYGMVDEETALEMVAEILAGVTLLRRLHDPNADPLKIIIDTGTATSPQRVERTDFV